MASPMNPETERQREDRATKLAYEKGRRDMEVDNRLNGHDEHLRAINGSIERGARATERVESKVDALAEQVRTEGAVGKALAAQATAAIERQVSTRDFRIGVAMVIAMLLGVIVSVLTVVH
jgi:hypothetical protein